MIGCWLVLIEVFSQGGQRQRECLGCRGYFSSGCIGSPWLPGAVRAKGVHLHLNDWPSGALLLGAPKSTVALRCTAQDLQLTRAGLQVAASGSNDTVCRGDAGAGAASL